MHRPARLPRPFGDSRPRVLLVDDHPAVLSGLSTMLSDDFDVAGAAASGRQALEMVERVSPDVIVLDINMPGLNGFQTLQALDQAGSRVPAVFLSMMNAADFVSEAFRHGGRGYVVKSRAANDLPSAIEHVLGGRLFVPSLSSMGAVTGGRGHAMIVQGDLAASFDRLAAFLDHALSRGEPVCVIATADVRAALASRLGARGVDVTAPPEQSRYLVVDAAASISRFLVDGRPDATRLGEIAAELEQFRRTAAAGRAAPVTIFGNMVELLNAAGNPYAAVELEHLWNTLTAELPFFTICGYATSCFRGCGPEIWAGACAAHAVVTHASDL